MASTTNIHSESIQKIADIYWEITVSITYKSTWMMNAIISLPNWEILETSDYIRLWNIFARATTLIDDFAYRQWPKETTYIDSSDLPFQ